MSMHKKPLTPLEEEGLRLHGLDIGTPSQLSDVFRHGIAWALSQDQSAPKPVQGEAAMRKRFDQIEREIMEGKHTAASVFTQMRTAAHGGANTAAAKPDAELVALLKRVHQADALSHNCPLWKAIDAKLAELQS